MGCQVCRKARRKITRQQNKVSNRPREREKERRYKLAKFGLSPEMFEVLVVEQGGLCSICCGGPTSLGLCIDHNHKSGRMRGLLCGPCNSAIGLLKDSPEIVEAAAKYLRQYSEV